jgi:hypothetical protein
MPDEMDMTGAVPLGPFYGEPEPDPTPNRPLSPAAQAVLDAFWEHPPGPLGQGRDALAAALRAVADEACPSAIGASMFERVSEFDEGRLRRNDHVRSKILAIATELENING